MFDHIWPRLGLDLAWLWLHFGLTVFGAWGQGGAEATALGVGLAERCFLAAPSAASLRQARLCLTFWLSGLNSHSSRPQFSWVLANLANVTVRLGAAAGGRGAFG